MVSKRVPIQAYYDSLLGVPELETPLTEARDRDSVVPSGATDNVVALSVRSASLRLGLLDALRARNVSVGGAELVSEAAVVLAEVSGSVSETMADLRGFARPDAAVLVVAEVVSSDMIAAAHAMGAYACLRWPIVPEELAALVSRAIDAHASQVHVASLTRQLDLDSHLASVGTISAGLAHELGSPLSVVKMNMEIARTECARLLEAVRSVALASPSDLAGRVAALRAGLATAEATLGPDGVMEDGRQALERAEALLRFAREFAVEWRPAVLEQVPLMDLSRKVIAELKGDLVGVEIDLVGGEVVAPAEPRRLAQVVQNLLVNGAQAAKRLPTPRVRLHVYESRGDAILSVRDNGPGISTEHVDRIFEPFFTTHRAAGALGLGLPLCQEFALQMKAELSFSSAPGRGACFRLRFPRGA